MARKLNLVIDQGTTFSYTIYLNDANGSPQDLSDFTARSQLRKSYGSTSYTAFTTYVGGPAGSVTISLSAAQTSTLKAGRYVYDIEMVNTNLTVSRLAEGIVTVNPEVTR
jgi:hypothetical protein